MRIFYQKQWNFNGELKTRVATENQTRDDNTMMKYESVNVWKKENNLSYKI